jgi:hypothetical protein
MKNFNYIRKMSILAVLIARKYTILNIINTPCEGVSFSFDLGNKPLSTGV